MGRAGARHRRSSATAQVGFLGRTDAELAAALELERIDRLACRTWAAQRFSLELMAKGYEEQYLLAAEDPRAA